MTTNIYDAIVIGGSAAGLSATLAIARTLSSILCIDSGKPCNIYAGESHNFLTHDGESPLKIKATAWDQITKYPNANLINDEVISIDRKEDDESFIVKTKNQDEYFVGKNILFASGVNDNIETSDIKNLEKFWGHSCFTCGYCHGYEYANKRAGLVANENFLNIILPMIYNWNKNITIFKDPATLSKSNLNEKEGITIISDSKIVELVGENGEIDHILLENGKKVEIDVLYYVPNSVINLKDQIIKLGVELDQMGLIKVDKQSQMTNIPGIYAAGDCSTMMRSLAIATQTGQTAAVSMTHKFFAQKWNS